MIVIIYLYSLQLIKMLFGPSCTTMEIQPQLKGKVSINQTIPTFLGWNRAFIEKRSMKVLLSLSALIIHHDTPPSNLVRHKKIKAEGYINRFPNKNLKLVHLW